jgi:hypothetical protein
MMYEIYVLGQSSSSIWYWQFHVHRFHRNTDEIHNVYRIYLLEKLNISDEINSFSYLHMKIKILILFNWNIWQVSKKYKCVKYVISRYRFPHLVQLPAKLCTIRQKSFEYYTRMYSNFIWNICSKVLSPRYIFINDSRIGVVSTVTILQAGRCVVRFPAGEGDFSHLPNVKTDWGSPSLVFNICRAS